MAHAGGGARFGFEASAQLECAGSGEEVGVRDLDDRWAAAADLLGEVGGRERAGSEQLDQAEGVMKKCTLCVDRIYNENLPEVDRQPACVRTCPAGARHFGDFADPESNVSKLTAERGGMDLMPELDTAPVNKYLPPRLKDSWDDESVLAPFLEPVAEEATGFVGWLDKQLSRLPGDKSGSKTLEGAK